MPSIVSFLYYSLILILVLINFLILGLSQSSIPSLCLPLRHQLSWDRKSSLSLERPRWGIVSRVHTIVVANRIAEHLRFRGIAVTIFFASPPDFDLDSYIVLGASFFDRLPPFEKLIVYQLEQSVASRWFTPAYWNLLRAARFVLDYSLTNIAFLKSNLDGAQNIFYLPLGALPQLSSRFDSLAAPMFANTYDILFFGESLSSERRQRMLSAAKAEFRVAEITDMFGSQVFGMIQKARIVLNIHYYENGLLETARILECISLGTMVVSEDSVDRFEYPELLHGAISFFEQNSTSSMLSVLHEALRHSRPTLELELAANASSRRFAFMFDRFLIGANFIKHSHINTMPLYFQNQRDITPCSNFMVDRGANGRRLPPTCITSFVLSSPESLRLKSFVEMVGHDHGFYIFDGFVDFSARWKGCALSYAKFAQFALQMNFPDVLVVEDDVLFQNNHISTFTKLLEAIRHRQDWDLFSGLIADAPVHTKILNAFEYDENTMLATVNEMTSTVFTIFRPSALRIMAEWDITVSDPHSNTIDRLLQRNFLSTLVTLPYLVGHKGELFSTLWGIKNTQYDDLINRSEALLLRKASNFLRNISDEDNENKPLQPELISQAFLLKSMGKRSRLKGTDRGCTKLFCEPL